VLASRVGRDDLGDEVIELLNSRGLPTGHIQKDAKLPTGTVIVKVDKAGQPTFDIVTNVACDNLRVTKKLMALAPQADAVCYGTFCQRSPVTRATIRKFLGAAKTALIVCDVNLRGEFIEMTPGDSGLVGIVADSMTAADVVKLNDDEVRILRAALARPERGDEFLRWLLREFGLKMVCVTLGAKGCVLRTPRKRVTSPGVKVKVADTVGAGDAFTAGLVNRMLRGCSLQEVADFANRIGAYVASKSGAMPPAA
jgi:fructokinase